MTDALAKLFYRLRKRNTPRFLDPLKGVSTLPAPKTMKDTFARHHIKARGLFFMKRAEPNIARPLSLERDRLPDQFDNIDTVSDGVENLFRYHADLI